MFVIAMQRWTPDLAYSNHVVQALAVRTEMIRRYLLLD